MNDQQKDIEILSNALQELVDECEAEFTVDGEWSDTGQLVQRKTFNNAVRVLKSIRNANRGGRNSNNERD